MVWERIVKTYCFKILRFYRHSLFGRPSGDCVLLFTFLPTSQLFLRPPGAPSFAVRFCQPRSVTDGLRRRYLSLREERYRRKTRQRAPKPPFGFWLFIRGFGGETCGLFYVCARVQLTRFRPARGVCKHTVSTDSIVLHELRRMRKTFRISSVVCNWKSGGCVSLSIILGTRSTQRRGDKRSAEADVIASHAPLRDGSHKARQNGPKHYSGDSRGRSPLTRLSPLSFVVQRKMGSPKGVRKKECRIKRTTQKTVLP